jgi:hypothetical protein
VEDGAEALALRVVLHLVGLGDREVLVHLADHPHRLGDRGPEPVLLHQIADGREAVADGREHLLVDLLERAGCGDLAEVLGDHRGGAVDQVAPAGDELGVVAAARTRPT